MNEDENYSDYELRIIYFWLNYCRNKIKELMTIKDQKIAPFTTKEKDEIEEYIKLINNFTKQKEEIEKSTSKR